MGGWIYIYIYTYIPGKHADNLSREIEKPGDFPCVADAPGADQASGNLQ